MSGDRNVSGCPIEFICPITQELLRDPVLVSETGQVCRVFCFRMVCPVPDCAVAVCVLRISMLAYARNNWARVTLVVFPCRHMKELQFKTGGHEVTTHAQSLARCFQASSLPQTMFLEGEAGFVIPSPASKTHCVLSSSNENLAQTYTCCIL